MKCQCMNENNEKKMAMWRNINNEKKKWNINMNINKKNNNEIIMKIISMWK